MSKYNLPDNWAWVPLEKFAIPVGGYGFPEKWQGRENLRYPFIKVSDMNNTHGYYIDSAKNTVDESILSELRARTYPVNTIIFPKVGGAIATNKKRILAKESTFDNNVMGIVVNSESFIDVKWLFNYLLTIDLMDLAHSGPLPSIRQSSINQLEIPVPFPNEPKESRNIQTRLLRIVDQNCTELSEARRMHEKIVSDTNRLMDAVLKETFADLTSRYPTEDLNDDKICLIIPGQHIMANDYSNKPGNGLPYITGPEDFRDIFPVISKWTEEKKVIAHPGDVLFTVKGSGVGKVNLMIDNDCVIGRQVMAIRPNQELLLDEYLFYALLGRYQEFQSMRQGAAIPGIRKEHVKAIKLPLPPTDTQASVVIMLGEYKKAIQQMVEDQTRTKVLLNQMEQSILAQAFRGEL